MDRILKVDILTNDLEWLELNFECNLIPPQTKIFCGIFWTISVVSTIVYYYSFLTRFWKCCEFCSVVQPQQLLWTYRALMTELRSQYLYCQSKEHQYKNRATLEFHKYHRFWVINTTNSRLGDKFTKAKITF